MIHIIEFSYTGGLAVALVTSFIVSIRVGAWKRGISTPGFEHLRKGE